MNMEKELEKYFEQIKEATRKHIDKTMDEVCCGLLPYVVDDTICNAEVQAVDIVKAILAGQFEFDGDYAVIEGVREYSPRIHIKFTQCDYDNLRDKIIERMPECPKDAKIKMLERQIEDFYKSY